VWLAAAFSSSLGIGSPVVYPKTSSAPTTLPSPPTQAHGQGSDLHSDPDDETEEYDQQDVKVLKVAKTRPGQRRLGQKKWAASPYDLDAEVLVEGLSGPATRADAAMKGKVGTDSYLSSFVETACDSSKGTHGPSPIINITDHNTDSSKVRDFERKETAVGTASNDDDEVSIKSRQHEPFDAKSQIKAESRPSNGPVLKEISSSSSSTSGSTIGLLADGWEEVRAATGETYYYHKKTRVSR
jgi:hypothetical protein